MSQQKSIEKVIERILSKNICHLRKHVTSIRNNYYWQYFVKYISSFPLKNGLVLEIGGGDVERVQAMKQIFPNLVELELYFDRIPKLREVKFANADAQYMPFKNASFDCVIAHHVIEHIPNDLLFLQEMYRVLKKGGFAVIGTPNRERLPEAIRAIFVGKRKFPYLDHVREYVKEDLLVLISTLPFRSIAVDQSFFGIWGGTPFIIGLENCPNFLEKYAHFLFFKLQK